VRAKTQQKTAARLVWKKTLASEGKPAEPAAPLQEGASRSKRAAAKDLGHATLLEMEREDLS